MAWGAAWADTGRVFTREDGTDLHPTRVSEQLDALVRGRACRASAFTTCATGILHAALPAGVNPKVGQERLGHGSVTFTLDRYSHAVPAMQEDAAETVARLIGPHP